MKALRLHADFRSPEGMHIPQPAPAAATWENPRLNVDELPVPQAGADDMLIRVSYSGLGGGDFELTAMAGPGRLAYPGCTRIPITLGYEFSGVIAGYGISVPRELRDALPIGTPITAEDLRWCGHCTACRSGQMSACAHAEKLGFTSDGAHAEYLTVPARLCWSLAPIAEKQGMDFALRLGALTNAYAAAFRGMFGGGGETRWTPGGRVLVIGCGPVGLATLDLAIASGAADVQVLEIDPARRQTARELGASLALAPEDADTLADNFDWVIDAAGAPATLATMLEKKAARGSAVLLLGRSLSSATLPAEVMLEKNLRLMGTRAAVGGGCFERVIRMLAAGRLQPEKVLRETITLEQAATWLASQKKCEGKVLVSHGNI
jgi:threonine dehydrogenase-like Zn-dependent dehydrogenase